MTTTRKYQKWCERGRYRRKHLEWMVREGHFLEVTLSWKMPKENVPGIQVVKGKNTPDWGKRQQWQRPKGRTGQSVSGDWRGGPCGWSIGNKSESGTKSRGWVGSHPTAPYGLWLESCSQFDGHLGRDLEERTWLDVVFTWSLRLLFRAWVMWAR